MKAALRNPRTDFVSSDIPCTSVTNEKVSQKSAHPKGSIEWMVEAIPHTTVIQGISLLKKFTLKERKKEINKKTWITLKELDTNQ